MLRKYNYNIETGTVGTDDDNIANILYNINRMEMRKSYSCSDLKELDRTMGELFFMISDSKVHLNRFLKIFGEKVNADTVNVIITALDNALQTVRTAREDESDTVKMCTAFPDVYQNLLEIVPTVLDLDNQAVGRV